MHRHTLHRGQCQLDLGDDDNDLERRRCALISGFSWSSAAGDDVQASTSSTESSSLSDTGDAALCPVRSSGSETSCMALKKTSKPFWKRRVQRMLVFIVQY